MSEKADSLLPERMERIQRAERARAAAGVERPAGWRELAAGRGLCEPRTRPAACGTDGACPGPAGCSDGLRPLPVLLRRGW